MQKVEGAINDAGQEDPTGRRAMDSGVENSDSEDGEEPYGAFGLAFGTNGSTDEEGGANDSFGGAFGKSLGESPPDDAASLFT